MNRVFQAHLILSAIDRATSVVNNTVNKAVGKLNELQKKSDALGKSAQSFAGDTLAMGAAAAATLYKPIEAFANLEDSATRLKTVLMKDGGIVSENYDAINNIAIELGNRLPGTTADFQNMMAALLKLGVQEESIMQGVGQSAAYLAVALQLPFEDAAVAAAKLKEATGVADGEMLGFLDTIARVNQLGVEVGEMQYAFARSGGQLKLMGVQGLEASKSISAVYAMLIKAGASGETVGTGMSGILSTFMDTAKMAKFNEETAKLGVTLSFVDEQTGQFKGVENMISEFDKLKNFNPAQRASLVSSLLGPGQDAQFMNTLIDKGIDGYNEMMSRMAAQATLDQKVNAQLDTLKNVWDAATGTFENTLAAFAASFAPELKALANGFGVLAESVGKWLENNPQIAKFIGLTIMAFAAVMAVLGTAGVAVVGFTKVWSFMLLGGTKFLGFAKFVVGGFGTIARGLMAVGKFALANPIVLIIAAVAVAAFLIYKYWGPISAFFKKLWEAIKRISMSVWNSTVAFFRRTAETARNIFWTAVEFLKNVFLRFTPLGIIIKNFSPIVQFFGNMWENVKSMFTGFQTFLTGLGTKFYNAGANIVNSIWDGIKAMANKPIQAIQEMAAEMRSYMPFSPAKKGALRDIHRIRLVETIAASMRPNSVIEAMKNTANATLTAAPKLFQPVANSVSNFLSTGGISRSTGAISPTQRGSAAGATINYSPTINITGGGASAREEFAKMLNEHKTELMRIIGREKERNERKNF